MIYSSAFSLTISFQISLQWMSQMTIFFIAINNEVNFFSQYQIVLVEAFITVFMYYLYQTLILYTVDCLNRYLAYSLYSSFRKHISKHRHKCLATHRHIFAILQSLH